MKTFTNTELEYLIAAVQSKFDKERDHIQQGVQNGHLYIPSLASVEADVIRVIRKWSAPETPARTLHATVEVYGGVAEVTHTDTGVEVTIIDHDNLEAEA